MPRSAIRTLTPSDLDGLRFSDWSRNTNEDVKRTLVAYPGRSVWLPDTHEYAIVAPWRHRDEIAHVSELSAVRHPSLLLDEIVERADEFGAALVVALELDETRQPAFYARSGFECIEHVITYEYPVRGDELAPPDLQVRPADPLRREDLDNLLDIDHRTFPWLWWNNEREFQSFSDSPGTEAYLCYRDGQPVSYVTLTAFLGWGHLDRIAVLPDRQGEGLGLLSLRFAVARLAQLGARRVGLSTQATNQRSRRLYERFGYLRANENDYRLYARILRKPERIDQLI